MQVIYIKISGLRSMKLIARYLLLYNMHSKYESDVSVSTCYLRFRLMVGWHAVGLAGSGVDVPR